MYDTKIQDIKYANDLKYIIFESNVNILNMLDYMDGKRKHT